MTDRKHPFDPQEVEKQVDQLSSAIGETYGTSQPDQRFLHDLRLVLTVGENDAQSAADDHFLNSAWARITATGHLSQHPKQRAYPSAQHRRFTIMSTLPSTPGQPVARRGSFKRLLTTLAAAIVALALVGTLAVFTLASRPQQQPNTGVGSHQSPTQNNQSANSYVYSQPGMPVYNLQWSSDGKRLISANENVYGWDAFSGKHVTKYTNYPIFNGISISSNHKPQPLFTSLSPDNKTLAVWNVGQIDLYDVATGKHLSTLTYPFAQKPDTKFNAPSFSPYISWSSDGKSIRALAGFPASGYSRTNKLVTFDITTGTHQEFQLSLKGLLDQAAWSPNGKYVAVGWTSEGTVAVIDIASGQVIHKLHFGAPIETIPLSWSPDSSKLIADFGNNSGLYVWKVATNQNDIYQGGSLPVWSPNGKYIAVSSDSTIKILDAANGHLLHTFTSVGQTGLAAWSPDGSAIAVGGKSADGKSGIVNVWKVTF